MTEEQLKRLSPLLREIVEADRRLTALRREPVISMTEFTEQNQHARRLRDAAAKAFGPRSSGNGKASS